MRCTRVHVQVGRAAPVTCCMPGGPDVPTDRCGAVTCAYAVTSGRMRSRAVPPASHTFDEYQFKSLVKWSALQLELQGRPEHTDAPKSATKGTTRSPRLNACVRRPLSGKSSTFRASVWSSFILASSSTPMSACFRRRARPSKSLFGSFSLSGSWPGCTSRATPLSCSIGHTGQSGLTPGDLTAAVTASLLGPSLGRWLRTFGSRSAGEGEGRACAPPRRMGGYTQRKC